MSAPKLSNAALYGIGYGMGIAACRGADAGIVAALWVTAAFYALSWVWTGVYAALLVIARQAVQS